MIRLEILRAFIITSLILLLSYLLLFFYFINKFAEQAEFDFRYLIENIKSYDSSFFREFDLNNYFLKVLREESLVNSYYLFSSKDGLIVFNAKNNFLYKISNSDEPIIVENNFFIKKLHVTFELNDEKINLVVYYNILPKSRILYVFSIYLFLTALLYIGFFIYVLYLLSSCKS